MGSRAAICGRRGLPNAKRALYFGKLRNAVSNTQWNPNGYTDRNTYAYCDSKHHTQRDTDPNTYRHPYSHP
jgi:hypothetical protein